MENITKQELVDSINEIKKLDNEIDLLNKELRERKNKKKQISDILVNVMKSNEIDRFDTKDGNIVYTENKIKQSISKKYLLETVENYFKENTEINYIDLVNYIFNKRQITVKETIKHKKINYN
tara:strand:+ start:953 stop:1321 length:369 start_codon:yes stop_codon:yes gene_type:complete